MEVKITQEDFHEIMSKAVDEIVNDPSISENIGMAVLVSGNLIYNKMNTLLFGEDKGE